jgi:hypothetical protein
MTPEEIRKQMMISAGFVGPKYSPTPAKSSAPAAPETHVEEMDVSSETEQVIQENSPIDDAVASSQDNALEASPAEPSPRKKRKSKSASSASQSLAKVEAEVAQPAIEPPPSKPESKLVLFFLVFFMGPIPLFFLSWKRAVLSILILIISLGIPMSPLMKYLVFWIGIPLFLLITKKRS